MKQVNDLLQTLSEKLTGKSAAKAVMATPISAGDCHVVPLCEVAIGMGSGGGQGVAEGDAKGEGQGQGTGGGAGGGAQVRPVAVLIVDQDGIRVERLG
jgi:uncharacterized spore protein YtfJ